MEDLPRKKASRFLGFIERHEVFFLVLFLLASTFRYYFVEQSIFEWQVSWQLPVLFCVNTSIFIGLFHLRRALFGIIFYAVQSLYLLVCYVFFLHFTTMPFASQFFLQFKEGVTLLRHGMVPFDPSCLLIFLDLPFLIVLVLTYPALHRMLRGVSPGASFLRKVCAVFLLGQFFLITDLATHGNFKNGLFFQNIGQWIYARNGQRQRKYVYKPATPIVNKEERHPFKNVICIQVESLDADLVNYKYKGGFILPFLHQLTAQSVYYPYMRTIKDERKGAGTSDTEFFLLNSGVLPQTDSFRYQSEVVSYPNSLLHPLAKCGYELKAFHNNDGSFYNRDRSFPRMGFAQFYDRIRMHLEERGWGASDADVFQFVKEQLKTQKSPFFYYIITMSSHEPYTLVKQYYHNPQYDDIEESLVRDYFNSFSYVDDCLRDLVTFIRNNVHDAYIIIFGDHPSELGIRSLFHDDYVPLFIVTPEGRRYVEGQHTVTSLDLAPTILFASGTQFSILSEGKNILRYPSAGRERYYDYANGSLYSRFSRLDGSDYMFRKKQDLPPRYVAHGGGEADDRIVQTNSREAIDISVGNGFRLLELDFEWTRDDQMVLLHDWGATVKRLFGAEPRVYSLEEFQKLTEIKGLSQMSLDDLADWLRKTIAVRVVTDIKRLNIQGLGLISERYKDIQHQIIPQIYHFNEYAQVLKLGYPQMILTLYTSHYSDEEILKFVKDHKLFAVAMPEARARTGLPAALHRLGVFVYAHTVNDPAIERELSENGVDGFYTDYLRP